MVCIQGYPDPSIIHIVLDSIFHQITDGKSKFHLIHVCFHRTETIQDQVDVPFVRDWTQTFQNVLQKLVDIHMCDIHIRSLLIHFYQRKKVCDDLVFTIDLGSDIAHKFLIQFLRDSLLSYQRICQNLHGSQRCFQLMGHIGYELLPGFVQNLHTVDHLVESICDQLCLCIVRNTDFFIQHTICQVLNGLRNSGKRFHKDCRQQPRQKYRKHYDHTDQHNASLFQFIQCLCNVHCGNCYQHHTLKLLNIRTLYRNCYFQNLASGIKIVSLFSFDTCNCQRTQKRFPFFCMEGISYDLKVSVSQQNSSIINVGKHLKLTVYCF